MSLSLCLYFCCKHRARVTQFSADFCYLTSLGKLTLDLECGMSIGTVLNLGHPVRILCNNMHLTKRRRVWGMCMEDFGVLWVWVFCGDSHRFSPPFGLRGVIRSWFDFWFWCYILLACLYRMLQHLTLFSSPRRCSVASIPCTVILCFILL